MAIVPIRNGFLRTLRKEENKIQDFIARRVLDLRQSMSETPPSLSETVGEFFETKVTPPLQFLREPAQQVTGAIGGIARPSTFLQGFAVGGAFGGIGKKTSNVAKQITKKAEKEIGFTDDFFNASFILPEGQLVKTIGSHSFIAKKLLGSKKSLIGDTGLGINDFLDKSNAIRINVNTNVRIPSVNLQVSVAKDITNSQLKQLSRIFKEGGDVFVDFIVPTRARVIGAGFSSNPFSNKVESLSEFMRLFEKAKNVK